MSRTLGRVAMSASAFVLLSVLVLVVNQTAQVVELARSVHPTLGQVVMWTLLGLYAAVLIVPLALILRLPAPLRPPASANAPAFPRHLAALRRRLRTNPHLHGQTLATAEDVQAALSALAGRADEIIRRTASTVFVSTAVSQNGKLDGLLVLTAQSRMVWQIAHLYWQRPTLRDLGSLYANVAGTAFIASGIEDADLGEQIAPLVTAAVGGAVGAIPGFQTIASLLTESFLTGSANAYLTLRIGVITRRYCSSLVLQDPRVLRRAAAAEAALMLGSVAQENATRITKAVWSKCSGPFTKSVQAAAERTATAASAAQSAGRDVAGAVGQALTDAFTWLRSRSERSKPWDQTVAPDGLTSCGRDYPPGGTPAHLWIQLRPPLRHDHRDGAVDSAGVFRLASRRLTANPSTK